MSRNSSLALGLAVLCWLWAAPAPAQENAAPLARQALACGAPEETVARVLAAVVQERLTQAQGDRVLAPLVRACAEGLPPALLADKIDEGLAKSVPPEALTTALERRLEDLRFVRALPGLSRDGVLPAEILAGLAEALAAGLEREALAGLVQRHPQAAPDMLARAARLWAFLGRAGLAQPEAQAVADAGLEARALAPDWLQFPRLAATALRRGASPQAVRDAALDSLRDGGGLREAAARLGLTVRDLDSAPRASVQ